MPSGEVARGQGQERLIGFVAWLNKKVGAYGPCPTLLEIARAHGLQRGQSAGTMVRRAEQAGLIQREGRNTAYAKDGMVRILQPQASPWSAEARSSTHNGVLSSDGFAQWLRSARPGGRETYFIGHLAAERGKPVRERDQVALAAAEAAGDAAEAGLVLLTTKRVDGEMTYVAVRTAKPLRVPA